MPLYKSYILIIKALPASLFLFKSREWLESKVILSNIWFVKSLASSYNSIALSTYECSSVNVDRLFL